MLEENLSWKEIKKEIYATLQPIESLSKKLRVGIDYQDGFFNVEMLMNKVQCFLDKMETCQKKDFFAIDIEILKNIKPQIMLFIDSVNNLDDEDRKILYYLLIKKEREYDVASKRMSSPCSVSKLNRLKKNAFSKLLENIKYNSLMQQDDTYRS